MAEVFDYVIVGAGSAGCVLALRLAEAGHRICVLEAGPPDRSPYIHIPAGYVKNIFSKTLTWNFESAAIPGTGDRRIALTQGRVVGGSSAINGMVYNRGQHADFDAWAQRGNPGWSYSDVLPFFKKSEARLGGEDEYRGRSGPLTVADLHETSPLCALFVEAAKQTGAAYVEDYNAASMDGVAPYQFTIDGLRPFARRMSAARAFLRPAIRTGRVTLRTNAPALKVLVENGRAVGVRYRRGGPGAPEDEVRAGREVIVSAGALNTPRLLQISGIGPHDLVRELGIDPVVDLPGVGQNLCDHFNLRIAVRVRDIPSLNERGRGLPLGWEVAKWMIGRPSILSSSPVTMRLCFRSNPALENTDLQVSFSPGSYREGLPGLLEPFPGMTLGGHTQRPASRGHVRALSTDIDTQPEIQPNYLTAESDQRDIVAIVRMARRIMQSESFAPYYVGETFPGPEIQADDEILDFARQRGGTVYHHIGTCRMGPEGDAGAVVDARLRLRGIGGLRIADASVMPEPISGATNAVAIMIGEKAAHMVLEDAKAA